MRPEELWIVPFFLDGEELPARRADCSVPSPGVVTYRAGDWPINRDGTIAGFRVMWLGMSCETVVGTRVYRGCLFTATGSLTFTDGLRPAHLLLP